MNEIKILFFKVCGLKVDMVIIILLFVKFFFCEMVFFIFFDFIKIENYNEN